MTHKYLFIFTSIFLLLNCGVSKLSKDLEKLHLDNLERKELLIKLIDKKNAQGELTESQVKRYKDSINELFNRSKITKVEDHFQYKGKASQNKIKLEIVSIKQDLDFKEDQLLKDTRGVYGLNKTFLPGEYEIPKENYDRVINEGYQDLFDKILNEVRKYKAREIKADIVIMGYSDAQDFSKNSKTYSMLKEKAVTKNPSNETLNQILSELRAESIKKVFEYYFSSIEDQDIKNRLKVELKYIGKGVELPNSDVKYSENDERRRVVVIKWGLY
jgi:hypothetical protein